MRLETGCLSRMETSIRRVEEIHGGDRGRGATDDVPVRRGEQDGSDGHDEAADQLRLRSARPREERQLSGTPDRRPGLLLGPNRHLFQVIEPGENGVADVYYAL